jgi:hypothetical protein
MLFDYIGYNNYFYCYLSYRYAILQCGDVEKIVAKSKPDASSNDTVQYFTHIDDLYDIIKRAHISCGHGGRDKMEKILGTKYANITRDIILLYNSMCVECMKKRKRTAVKGVVVRPILTKDYGSRCQVDLVDMQSMSSGTHKWIMVYQVVINVQY